MTDLCCRQLGLAVPTVDEPTRARLQEISPPFMRMRNPVDIWASALQHGIEFAYREGMEAVLKDPNVDAVVPVLMLADETVYRRSTSLSISPNATRKSRST